MAHSVKTSVHCAGTEELYCHRVIEESGLCKVNRTVQVMLEVAVVALLDRNWKMSAHMCFVASE